MPRHSLGILLLVIVTCIWGSTFATVKTLGEHLAAPALIGWRFLLGTLFTLPLLMFWRDTSGAAAPQGSSDLPRRSLIKDSVVVGLWLVVGYAAQTIALQTTTANRAAFITALGVVLVPLYQALITRKPLPAPLWIAPIVALCGLALLSWEGGQLVTGDLWALGCTVSYVAFILSLSRAASAHPPLMFTLLQLLVVTVLAWLWAALSGHLAWPAASDWGPLLYLGIAATTITTLLQTVGQRWVSATEASIIYALEPVTASVFSYFLIHEVIGVRGLLGGALVVGATILSQWKRPKTGG